MSFCIRLSMSGLLFVALALVSGCGGGEGGDPRTLTPIKGVVKVAGKPLNGDGLQVVFSPADGQKGAYSSIGSDGTYQTEAVIGACKVYIVESFTAGGQQADAKALGVAEQYLDEAQSSLSIEVTDSGEPIDLEVGM